MTLIEIEFIFRFEWAFCLWKVNSNFPCSSFLKVLIVFLLILYFLFCDIRTQNIFQIYRYFDWTVNRLFIFLMIFHDIWLILRFFYIDIGKEPFLAHWNLQKFILNFGVFSLDWDRHYIHLIVRNKLTDLLFNFL